MQIKLIDVVKNYEIYQQEFEYAGEKGIAELLGWKIIFFHKMNDLVNTVAISFHEMDSDELVDIANVILKFLNMNFRFGDGVDVIKQNYGIADFTDSLYENIVRYNYVISADLFIAFGLKDNILSCLEIITDENMIREIISVREPNS